MIRTKELEIRTVIVSGKRKSFKAALARSILGVTFKKFKRRRQEFYKNRVYNEAVTESVSDWLYEYLLMHLGSLSDLEIKTYLKLKWNENGRILAVSDISVPIYMKVGELEVANLQVQEKFKNIRIDLFYSEIDARSKKLRSKLPVLMKSMGEGNFDYSEYDFLKPDGKEMARNYNIETVPTVILNAETALVDPDEKELRQEIERAFAPVVNPSDSPQFNIDPLMERNMVSLAELRVQ